MRHPLSDSGLGRARMACGGAFKLTCFSQTRLDYTLTTCVG